MSNSCQNTDMLSYAKRAMKITDIFYGQHNKKIRLTVRSFASPKQLPALLSCLVRFSCASWSPEAKLPIRACALLRGAFSRQMKMNAGNQRRESENLLKNLDLKLVCIRLCRGDSF